MAATFKIHEDEETISHLQENKAKDVKVGKRSVLGQIQNKYASETQKTINYATSKEGILFRNTTAASTGFTENIKALGLKDKDMGISMKENFVRSPLKDVYEKYIRAAESKIPSKVESPMVIDSSPVIPRPNISKKNDVKESTQSHKLATALEQTPLRNSFKNTNYESTLQIASPMSVDMTPTQPVTENLRNALDDLYGCHAYKQDIYKYLRKIEEEYRPKAYYMRRQPDVSYSMRTILVDWLVEVGEEYKLRNETLFMAVSYIDRFLSTMAVAKPKLQLLGTSAMFIAAKFEEIYPPEVGEFTYITDDSYTVKQVLRMERLILKVLSFDLSCPTSYTFIMHISSCVKLPSKVIYLAMYICELTLLEADPYLEYYPSLIASGAIALARHCLDYADVWPSSLMQATDYTLMQLGPVITLLNETHHKSFTLSQTAIRQKYKGSEYEGVSAIPSKRLVLRDALIS